MTNYRVTSNLYNTYKYNGNNSSTFGDGHVEPRKSVMTSLHSNKTNNVYFRANEQVTQGKGKMSIGAKWALGLGVATFVAVSTCFLTKGKKFFKVSPEQETKLAEAIKQGKLDKTYAEIFKSIEHLEGEKFINEAYKRLAESMGYNIYPKLYIDKNIRTSSSGHGYDIVLALKTFNTKEK